MTNKFLFGKTEAYGLFLKAGVVNNPMTIREITVNGESRDEYLDRPIGQYPFNSIGYYIKIGLTYSILGNKSDERIPEFKKD